MQEVPVNIRTTRVWTRPSQRVERRFAPAGDGEASRISVRASLTARA